MHLSLETLGGGGGAVSSDNCFTNHIFNVFHSFLISYSQNELFSLKTEYIDMRLSDCIEKLVSRSELKKALCAVQLTLCSFT